MRTIFRIARVELSSLFYSPIAWVLLILFLIQASMLYIAKVETYMTLQELGQPQSSLTFNFFANRMSDGIFVYGVLENLYLYIPLITMGLISKETSSGTIKLLFSSPVKLSEIVLGKYLAMLAFNLCMILILAIIVIFAAFHIEAMDWGLIISSFFAFFLLLSAYAAIGIFMSCLSTYQVVVAIATFAVLGLLKFIGTLWQEYDFLRDLTNNLSISGRTESIIYGLINTRDVLYYLLITTMFLTFTWLKLRGGQKSISWIKSTLNYSLVVILLLCIGYISSMPGFIGYLDTSRTKQNTISINAQQAIKEIGKEPLKITTYVNLLDPTYYQGSPKNRNEDKKRWEQYIRFKPNIKLDYVYYYDSTRNEYVYKANRGMTLDEIAERNAKAFKIDLDRFKKPAEIQKIIDLYPEKNRLAMQLEFKGKKTFLRTFDDTNFWPSEVETVAALKRITAPLPKIGFLQGEEERSIDKLGDRHYKLATNEVNIRASLINQGFDVESLSLINQDIPAGLTALVIADPRRDFEPAILAKIEQYIKDGGNLLLAGEPGKQSVLNPILKDLGVQLMDGTLVQGDKNFSPEEVKSYVTEIGTNFGRKISNLQTNRIPISTRGAAGLTYVEDGAFKIQPLLNTDEKMSWNKTGKLVLDSADVVYNPMAGDKKQSIPTGLALTRIINGKEQRILVTGDADFLSNAVLSKVYPETGNARFYQGFLGWFTYGKFPIEPTWPDPIDNSLKITTEKVGLVKMLMLGVVPGILLLMGTILLIRRKRK